MADPRFFTPAGPFSLAELAEIGGARLAEPGDAGRRIVDVAPLGAATADQLSFLDNRKFLPAFRTSAAGAAVVHPDLAGQAPAGMALLLSERPYRSFALIAQAFHPRPTVEPGIAASAVVDPSAMVDPTCRIGPGAVIGARAEIGPRCAIEANAVVGPGVVVGEDTVIGAGASVSHAIIGRRVTIYPGARIGQDGFGFAMDAAGHVRIPQLGRVLIGDDVEIGANSTIDRGAGSDTVIGPGCMIDNLVQIGHNVEIGAGCVIVAQTGISGSTRLGDHVVLAGQAGIAGHLEIGAGARVGAKSGVARNVGAGESVFGIPAIPIKQYWRRAIKLSRLADGKD